MHACCGPHFHAHSFIRGNGHTHANAHAPLLVGDKRKKSAKKAKKRRNPEEEEGEKGEGPKTGVCPHCNKEAESFEEVIIDPDKTSEGWCEDCVDNHAFTCDHCTDITSNNLRKEVDGYEWCAPCAAEDATECDNCSNLVDSDKTRSVGDQTWCESCVDDSALMCERCEELVPSEDTKSVRTGRRTSQMWCDDCVDRHSTSCDYCGNYVADSEVETERVDGDTWCQYCVENDAYWCEDCGEYSRESHDHEEDEDEGGDIREYHTGQRRGFSPVNSPWIERQPKPPVFFGVELEVECPSGSSRREYAEQVRNSLSREFLSSIEKDASLDHGFEIITQPAGLDTHRKEWSQANLKGLKSHDTNTCGLHVHISKNALSPLVLGRMAEFLNDEKNKIFVETFCRRSFNRYAKVVAGLTISKAQKRAREGERYEILNLTGSKTVEFRLPKGTTKVTTILATLEFCYALIRLCRVVSSKNLTTEALKRFIIQDDMLADTRFLRAYLVDKGLATAKEMRLPKKPPGSPPPPPEGDVRSNPRKARMNAMSSTYADMALAEYHETGEWV